VREQPRRLQLLGHFRLTHDDAPVRVSVGGQRLLAFLAVSDGPQRREHVAWSLWASQSDGRALASLRTALWRLPRPGGRPLFCDVDNDLELAADVDVDWRRCTDVAGEVIDGGRWPDTELLDALRADLLPSWYEEWLGGEQERFRQVRLHALEAASHRLLDEGATFAALCAGLAAVSCEPLRESAHRCVIAAHLAEGNTSEATRQCDRYLDSLTGAGLRPHASDALWTLFAPQSVRDLSASPRVPERHPSAGCSTVGPAALGSASALGMDVRGGRRLAT
jgi:DNA-binding SARP family transcriptional activator